MDDKHLDTMFQEKLSNHEVLPSPTAWSKLEHELDKSRIPIWYIWGKYAAGFLLLLGFGLATLYWDNFQPQPQDNLVAVTQSGHSLPETTPFSTKNDSVGGNTALSNLQSEERVAVKTPLPPKPMTNNIAKEQETSLANVRVDEPQPFLDQRNMEWTETLALEEFQLPQDFEVIIPELASENNEIAYTVKVVSRGYAIAPDKVQLVEGIENKLEKLNGFFTKVDKGFGDLQDAKNDLLTQVMASKRER